MPAWQAEFTSHGGIAQLGERQLCKLDVVGSIPSASTNFASLFRGYGARRGRAFGLAEDVENVAKNKDFRL